MASALPPEAIAYQTAHAGENKGPTVIAVSIVLMIINIVVLIFRFIARHVQKLPYKWDDWLSIPGLVS